MSEKIKNAIDHLSAICKNPNRFRMCIPVQTNDSDIILMEGYTEGLAAVHEVARLKSQLAKVTAIARELASKTIDMAGIMSGDFCQTNTIGLVKKIGAIDELARAKQKELDEILGEG